MTLWLKFVSLVYATILDDSVGLFQIIHESTQLNHQFLMKLRREFEPVCATLLNRSPAPSLDVCLQELLREEQCSKSQTILDFHKSVSFGEWNASALTNDKKDRSEIQFYVPSETQFYVPLLLHSMIDNRKWIELIWNKFVLVQHIPGFTRVDLAQVQLKSNSLATKSTHTNSLQHINTIIHLLDSGLSYSNLSQRDFRWTLAQVTTN